MHTLDQESSTRTPWTISGLVWQVDKLPEIHHTWSPGQEKYFPSGLHLALNSCCSFPVLMAYKQVVCEVKFLGPSGTKEMRDISIALNAGQTNKTK